MPPSRSQAFKLCSDDDDLVHVSFTGKDAESWTSIPAFCSLCLRSPHLINRACVIFLENHMSISRQPRILWLGTFSGVGSPDSDSIQR